jgi:hypothetical protein
MKDTPEISESPEKQVTKPPEKKIDTFGDLKASDNSGRIDTFDDIRKQGSDSSIKTFDDLRGAKEPGDKTKKTETTDKAVEDTPESTEQKRMVQATEDIKKNDWVKPEKWKTLSIDEKRIALDNSGKALGKAYDHPEPPLTTKKMGDPILQGTNGDGYSYRPESPSAAKQGIAGAEYGIKMNQDGMDPNTHKKLFGEDPREAVETYGHEFRHSYQHEQANAFDKGFKTDDPIKAKEWSENLKNYQQPPDAELAKTDPEKYFKQYEAYRNQPVERDANDFGSKLSSSVYGDSNNVDKADQ